jgi:O-antigen ligase
MTTAQLLQTEGGSYLRRFEKTTQLSLLLTVFCLPLSTGVGNAMYVVTLLLSLMYAFLTSDCRRVLQNPLTYLFWGFALLVAVGIVYSVVPLPLALSCGKKFLWLLLTPFLFYLPINEKLLRQCLNVFLLAICLTLILSYAKYFGWVSIGSKLGGVSVFKDHIVQSYLFCLAAAVILYRLLYERKQRLLYSLCLSLICVNMLFLSRGRIGYLILPLLFVFTWLQFRSVKTVLIPLLLCLFSIFVAFNVSPSVNTRVLSGIHNIQHFKPQPHQTTSMGIRLQTGLASWYAFLEKPILGYGTGGVLPAITQVPQAQFRMQTTDRLIDSAYLNMLLQYGLVGLLYLLMFYGVIWRFTRYTTPEVRFVLQYVVLMSLVGSIFNTWITETTTAHLFSLLCALALSQVRMTVRLRDMSFLNLPQRLFTH